MLLLHLVWLEPFFFFWLAGGSGVIVVQPRGRRADDGHLWRGDLESGKGRACDTAAHSAIETAERNVSRLPGERVQHIKHKSTALSEKYKERERERERERDCFDHGDDAQQVCHRCGSNVYTVRKRGRPNSLTTSTGPSARQAAAPTTTKSTVTSIARETF